MRIEREHAYLIRNYNELLMFIEELKIFGKLSHNSYLVNMRARFNHSFIRLSVDEDWDTVNGNYPKEAPTDTKSLTNYQKLHTSAPYNTYQCNLWSRQTIKYNKDKL